jgi:hypothetical protein
LLAVHADDASAARLRFARQEPEGRTLMVLELRPLLLPGSVVDLTDRLRLKRKSPH